MSPVQFWLAPPNEAAVIQGDAIRPYEDIAVEEMLPRRAIAHVRFPLSLSGRGVEAAEEAVTRAEYTLSTATG